MFIVKWYYETHSLKRVCDDFIQEFLNSVSLSNHAVLNLIFKKSKMNTGSMIYHIQDNHLWWPQRKERSDCKECHRMRHHIITTIGAAGRAFTHIDILYTLFHSLPIQNFDSTWIKASWFDENTRVLPMASSLHTQWCFSVGYILLQRWSLVLFR